MTLLLKATLSLYIVVAVASAGHSQGWPVERIRFVDGQTGWFSGDYGLFGTSDGGKRWERLGNRGTPFSWVSDFVFADKRIGWLIEGDSRVLFTGDGGSTWLDRTPRGIKGKKRDLALFRISFLDERHGWALGKEPRPSPRQTVADSNYDPGVVFATDDGGQSWRRHDRRASIYDGQLTGRKEGWLLEDRRVVYTTNGGMSWTSKNVGPRVQPSKLFFLDRMLGWVVDLDHRLFHTSDRGATWEALKLDPVLSPERILFVDRNVGWMSAFERVMSPKLNVNSVLLATKDGGHSWSIQYRETRRRRIEFYFLNKKDGWMVSQTTLGVLETEFFQTNDGGETWTNLHAAITDHF